MTDSTGKAGGEGKAWFGRWTLLGFGLAAILVLFGVYLWRAAGARPFRRTDYLLGTLFEITAYGPRARTGVEAAFVAVREIERLADPRRPDSDLSRLAAAAGLHPVAVDRRSLAMLRLARKWWRRSGGAFDVTVAPVVRAWGFDPGGTPHLPPDSDVAAAVRLVGGSDLVLDEGAGAAYLRRPGMAVDLGGLAKGYAADRAYEALKKAGVERALIDGGNSSIRVLGSPPRWEWWRIGLAHPRGRGEGFLAILGLRPGQAIGTSADNQRFFIAGGRRYAHIIDPRTGRPAGRAMLFSVVAGDAVTADILSTACFVLGPDEGLDLAAESGAEGLALTPEGGVCKTFGLCVLPAGR